MTGTNGKTTVTSLIGDMFKKCLNRSSIRKHRLCCSKVAQEVKADEYLITELSSFQLLGIDEYKPHIAIITNIYSAHLDYHESLENYQNAKNKFIKIKLKMIISFVTIIKDI